MPKRLDDLVEKNTEAALFFACLTYVRSRWYKTELLSLCANETACSRRCKCNPYNITARCSCGCLTSYFDHNLIKQKLDNQLGAMIISFIQKLTRSVGGMSWLWCVGGVWWWLYERTIWRWSACGCWWATRGEARCKCSLVDLFCVCFFHHPEQHRLLKDCHCCARILLRSC